MSLRRFLLAAFISIAIGFDFGIWQQNFHAGGFMFLVSLLSVLTIDQFLDRGCNEN